METHALGINVANPLEASIRSPSQKTLFDIHARIIDMTCVVWGLDAAEISHHACPSLASAEIALNK
jgi:hypothetical protein